MVMVTESIAIIALTLCMVFLFVRSKHPDYAASVSPILCVPTMHLLAFLVLRAADHVWVNVPFQIVVALADIVALAVSCALFVTCSVKIKRVRTKRLYIVLMVGYSVVLTCVYVYQIMEPLRTAYLQNLLK